MAFQVPDHLPRKAAPQDISSKILSKIDSATFQSLNSALATSWVAELDESISSTKTRIHDRIQEDLPKFSQQLETSKSVQTRLHHLSREADALKEMISNPKTGLVPTTLHVLEAHSALAQRTSDAAVAAEALSHILKCRQNYTSAMSLVQFGKLPEAVAAAIGIEDLVNTSPIALERARIMKDLKHKLQALKARVEEQLIDALARSLVLQSSTLTVQSSVQVRDSDVTITLDVILSSLSSESLREYLSTFRRDFIAYFLDHVLQQPYSLKRLSNGTEHQLSLVPSSPNTEARITRLHNLSHIFDFAAERIFVAFPESQASTFLRSLCRPVTTSVLSLFLAPQLPASFGLLPPFLEVVQAAVEFERKYLSGLLGADNHDHPIKDWFDGLSGHYERQRRVAILEQSRSLITEPIDLSSTFQVDVGKPFGTSLPTLVVNGGSVEDDAWGFEDDTALNSASEKQDSWGLDDDGSDLKEPLDQPDGWGFDDDAEPDPEPEIADTKEEGLDHGATNGVAEEDPDPSDAWGWNDDNLGVGALQDESTEETVWDDDPWADPAPAEPEPEPISVKVGSPTPKSATRLEKLASKNAKHLNGSSSHQSPCPALSQSIHPSETLQTVTQSPPQPSKPAVGQRPSNILTNAPTEAYRVTERTKRVIRLVEDIIAEAKQFAASNLFSKLSSGSIPGATLFQSATTVLDLYQAIYPVRFEKDLESVEAGLQFSNDCLYLGESIEKLEHEASGLAQLKERLSECRNHLNILSDSWYDDVIERECLRLDRLLVAGTQGFVYTADQERYDECESSMGQVLQDIKNVSRRVKPILSKSKYYQALGRMADASLSRVLRDIIALPDIPEVESNRLSELCHIFNALEGLFSEDPTQPSFVVAYVPSWLKFSYLSELLEASLADTTYLFEQGALVDFDIDELIKLVRALFADTPLRTNTINKLLEGHPVPSSS